MVGADFFNAVPGFPRRRCSDTLMAAPRRFPPPWSVGETDDACFIVRDAWPATLLIKIKAQHTKKASGFHFRNSSHETASMSEADNKAIVFLLAAILCVMLFGASAVLTGFVWVAVIGVVLLVIFGVAAVIPNVLAYLAGSRSRRSLNLFVAGGPSASIRQAASGSTHRRGSRSLVDLCGERLPLGSFDRHPASCPAV